MNTDESVKLLARVDERTEQLQKRLEEFVDRQEHTCARCFEDHEDRIRSLEKWQWKATGIASALSAFGGGLAGIFLGRGGT
jgi:hypothetical protein